MADGRNQVAEDTASLRVKFWDLGPKKPVMPERPEPPKTDDVIAKLEYDEAAAQYVAEIQVYRRLAAEFQKWETECGGPVEIERWSVEARDAVARDPKRYVKKLPKGMTPGHGHAENLRRKAAEDEEFRRVAATDPIFGQQGAAA